MASNLPDYRAYKGLIFDLDGTLIDSMPFHTRAWLATARAHGFAFDPDLISRWGGFSSLDVALNLQKMGYDTGDPQEFVRQKVALYRAHIEEVPGIAQTCRILKEAHGLGIKTAVATGTQRINAEDALRLHGLAQYTDALVSAESVTRHKPAPDSFLKAADLLGLKPSECAVFEDGAPGFAAAAAGGFDCYKVIGVTVAAFEPARR